MEKEKGITLIALVITILVLLILATIGVTSGIQSLNYSKFTKFTTELKLMQTEVNELYDNWQEEKTVVTYDKNSYSGDEIIEKLGEEQQENN